MNFEKILEENKNKIYRICRVYSTPPMEPQDLFQEVVFQIWKSLDSFKGKSSIDTWVYKITINVWLRSKMKLEKSDFRTDRFDSIHFTPVEKEINVAERQRFKYMKQCIDTLNASDTSLIVLYLDDFPYTEISLITGLSENNIAVKMKRIRKSLFDCIAPKLK